MDASTQPDRQAVCTVTQMAKRLRLSRARFYQLIEAHVFPPPVYCPFTRRPLYPLDIQETCIKIRETGIGLTGQFVRFYERRKTRKPDPDQTQARAILRGMGLSVTAAQIQKALVQIKVPRSGQRPTDPEVIRMLFQHFQGTRQNDV